MDTQRPSEKQKVALMDCFAKETWIALGVAVVCLSVDAYPVFRLPHHPTAKGADHGLTVFSVGLWTVQIVLAVLALWLVRFALSRPPRFLPQA